MRLLKKIEGFLFKKMTLSARLKYLTAKRRLTGRHITYSLHARAPLMVVNDRHDKLVFCRPDRAGLYRRGVDRRVSTLEKSYLLLELEGQLSGGVFIDCGANVGELGRFARRCGLDYHAFEPEELEASCCDENNYGGEAKTTRNPLWNEVTTLSFFSKPDSADSSLIEMNDFVGARPVTTTTLDTYVRDRGISKIAVMKIEAEGAEPEILEGGVNALAMTDFVTVDCGFERGKEEASTLAPVANFLLRHGFELQSWDQKWGRFMFKRSLS